MNRSRTWLSIGVVLLAFGMAPNVGAQEVDATRQATLRGSIGAERAWWDVQHYDLQLQVFPKTKSFKGSNAIAFHTLDGGEKMQIDLQPPLEITKVDHGAETLTFEREGNVYWIRFRQPLKKGVDDSITIHYEGKPAVSVNPPWSGGISWAKDAKGKPFIASTCQGIGASIWWPNKDHGYDEPDQGMKIALTVPEDLAGVANGRLKGIDHDESAKTRTFRWEVTNPINNYSVNMNIGNYVNWSEKYEGEFGTLDMQYWVLDHQRATAEKHFREAPRTIEAFEHWFGKYPFYEDSYKLVVVPYLGMEHQSSVTYGNGFQNGYRGRDLSDTGVGLKFDFIIVHESGHEWFGNNISMKDAADMWIHESFTNYSENLFVEYHFTEKEAQDYVIGCRRLVTNDQPIIAEYGINESGSGDMYYKGGNMLHMIRHVIDDDEKWRGILRGLNKQFWHQTVTTGEIESYINDQSGIDFTCVFDQYLRSTMIPKFVYRIDGRRATYHLENVVDDFEIRVRVAVNGKEHWLTPTDAQKTFESEGEIESFELDRNFYFESVKN